MLHILLSREFLIAGFIVCLLLIAGSLVYQESVNLDIREREAKTERFLKQLETHKADRATQHAQTRAAEDFGEEAAPIAAEDVFKTEADTVETQAVDDEVLIDADMDLFLEEAPETDDVPVSPYGVSPYGFGPYPEVPAGFPENLMPVWTWSEEKLERIVGRQKHFELMHRVLIKLWNQGDQDFVGVTRGDDNGKVYPIYPDVAYVIWREAKDRYGNVRYRYPGFALSGPNVPRRTAVDFAEGKGYPPHVTVLDRKIAEIEPYQFLGLQKR